MTHTQIQAQSPSFHSENIAKLVDKVTQLASDYATTDKALVSQFVQVYYRNLSEEDSLRLSQADLAGMALHHLSLLKQYNRQSPSITVFNPTVEAQRFHSSHSVIQLVAYNRPFLVDTLLMGLETKGINVHRLFHTILQVNWDDAGAIVGVERIDNSETRYISMIHCEIDRCDAAELARIQSLLLDKVTVLDNVVADWPAMKTQLRNIKEDLVGKQVAGSQYSMDEVQTFLDWILDDHFIFLGYREYRFDNVSMGQLSVAQDTDNANNNSADNNPADKNSADKNNANQNNANQNNAEQCQATPTLHTVGGSGLGLLKGNLDNEQSASFHELPDELKHLLTVPQVLLLSKSSHFSPVHRLAYMDFLGIQKFDDNNQLVGEYRFIGLLTSRAYQLDVTDIPLLREKTAQILAKANLPKDGHAYHKMVHIINTLPRDDLFQGRVDELYDMVSGVANLQDRKRLRLFARIDHYQRFVSCLVYIPRSKFNTKLRVKIQKALTAAFGGLSSGFTTQFNESNHARVHIHVRTVPGHIKTVDIKTLEGTLIDLMQNWEDRFEQALLEHVGEAGAHKLLTRFLTHIPASYREQFDARVAVLDIERLDRLTKDSPLLWHLYQSTGTQSNQLNLKVYGSGEPAILSKVLPILEKFGVDVVSAQAYEFGATSTGETAKMNGRIDSSSDDNSERSQARVKVETLWMQEFELLLKHVDSVDMALVRLQFEQGLEQIWLNKVESDNLNELILTTKLETYEVVVLRALARYMQQAKAPFSRQYIERTLVKNSHISVLLVELFDARMNPEYFAIEEGDSSAKSAALQTAIETALSNVSSLDEDRIIRWYLNLLSAMLRTNYYQRDDDGQRKDRLAFKFASSDIINLPKPKPMFEIFVYSPSLDAIHLRSGKVARGGLRWSDRMEDFRTEVLGLVKAQIVKNTVIVPVGSKGGFIAKKANMAEGREAFLAEGKQAYKTFLRGMLDLTDNIVDGHIVHPNSTVRYDGDDPYLVVAADKGTATFSDIANSVSSEYNFWLGDAFASGGSVGYDHKAMGITAKGAWESVKRHFRLEGMDIQAKDDVTVVGIGDMSGDVFGNGMLLSKHIKLQAAFNHLHIFIDPNPNSNADSDADSDAAFNERARLFELPRSTWEDYNQALISQGGGVFSRADKSIAISVEMQQAFDIRAEAMTPNELIHALLKAPVDLIWNGGIGTYVKSSDESHADVGDRANDLLRVDGREVRAKVIGEGGNLGCTQRGRIEYARFGGIDGKGGRIYTDAIDNSGGVNCSDHEVNIKILLGKVVEQGDMTLKQRNQLLESMTDAVSELVLRQNYLQPQAIELSALDAAATLNEHQRFIQFLERQDRLDRLIEFLPSDDEISARREHGEGLTNPELAIVLAYGKMWVYDELLKSDLPDDPYFVDELRKYFPDELASRFFNEMTQHRLHREIISTYLTNSIVNRLGIEAIFRLAEDTDQSLASIVRAYTITRDVYRITQAWQHIEAMDNKIDATVQLHLGKQIRAVLERTIIWFINAFGASLDVSAMIVRFGDSVTTLTKAGGFIETHFEALLKTDLAAVMADGLAHDDAMLFVKLPYHIDALDAALLSEKYSISVEAVADLYFEAYYLLEIDWMLDKVSQLPQQTYWERRARYALINELNRLLRQLLNQVLSTEQINQSEQAKQSEQPKQALATWQQTHSDKMRYIKHNMSEVETQKIDLAVLSVIMSELTRLVD